MTNTQSLGTIEATKPVLAVAPLKEETEMLMPKRVKRRRQFRGRMKGCLLYTSDAADEL